MNLKDILVVMQRTFDLVSRDISRHAEQVAWLVLKAMPALGWEGEALTRMTVAALFHDIGAYKTNDLQYAGLFSHGYIHAHAVYGGLYIRDFSPLGELSDVVLYHHLRRQHRSWFDSPLMEEAQLLHLLDEVSLCALTTRTGRIGHLYARGGGMYEDRHLALLRALDGKGKLVKALKSGAYQEEIRAYWARTPLSRAQVLEYASMLAFAIDFRSAHTVRHTVTVTNVAKKLASLAGFDSVEEEIMAVSALLHDIGKIAVPTAILEKPGRLTDEEMAVMRRHAAYTKEILDGVGFSAVSDIAASHHEQLSGGGYPRGLRGDQINRYMRCLAVADVLSALIDKRSYKDEFSGEKTRSILADMAQEGKLDAGFVGLVLENYSEIVSDALAAGAPLLAQYDAMAEEYDNLIKKFPPI